MAVFIVIAAVSILGVLFNRTHLRFAAAAGAEGGRPAKTYGAWLVGRVKSLFTKGPWNGAKAVLGAWAREHYPGRLKWVFIAFAACLAYLAASGLFFAVFIPQGMFGYPLLAHVVAGGLFALSLAAVLLWRGRAYRFDKEETAVFERFACPFFENLSAAFVRKILFWALALFGIIQVVTALGSMLPLFTFDAQQVMIVVHRYSALAIVLTAIVFIDTTFIRRP